MTLLGGFTMGAARLFGRLKIPAIAKPVLGGVIFGVVGVALPLTMFSGSDQLKTVLNGAGTLGLGLLVATLIAKLLTFAVSQGSGFVGGPIFPSLFIGGTAGVIVHQVIPGVPLGLAFTCLLAAVPGALAPAPFSMVLMAAFLTQVGALQTAPILIAVVTAFLAMEGVKYLMASRKQARAPRRNQPPRRDQQLRIEGDRYPASSKDDTNFCKGDRNGVDRWRGYSLLCTNRHSWRYDDQERPLGHFCHWHLLAILLAYRRDPACTEEACPLGEPVMSLLR